jgi:Ni/Co efflux regulator RcnB
MTRLLISTAFAGLMVFGGAAWAQGQDDHRDRGRPGQAAPAAQPAAPAAQAPAARGAGPGNAMRGPSSDNAQRARPTGGAGPANAMRGPSSDNAQRARVNGGPGPSNAMRGASSNGGASNNEAPNNTTPNNTARGDDRRGGQASGNDRRGQNNANGGQRRDFSAYQRNFNAPRRFQASNYQRPRGWYSHRWSYGEILPSLFWASDYWLNDFNDYGLPPPPPGTVWVRDGEDALLIDRYSGEIIEVEYSVFY